MKKSIGIELLGTNEATEVVVLGQRDWTGNDLELLIERRAGEDLRIYSQEMFLTLGMCGSDPFDGPCSLLEAFRMGHPGLGFVSRRWQGWEIGYVDKDWRHHSHRRLAEVNWLEVSPMHVLGYCVGKTGQPTEERHQILKRAYTGRLPIIGPVEYMTEWGVEGSSQRLRKIADSIAAHCRNRKQKRTNTSDDAIRDWEADLDWLKAEFYHELRWIGWPGTCV
ncbi:MAG: hypothetical protein NTY19_24725 [Planctomycetota bacterium]|nr:hypothetical protein [Planctomycetota bacterium]